MIEQRSPLSTPLPQTKAAARHRLACQVTKRAVIATVNIKLPGAFMMLKSHMILTTGIVRLTHRAVTSSSATIVRMTAAIQTAQVSQKRGEKSAKLWVN
jgi:hypothetical protein